MEEIFFDVLDANNSDQFGDAFHVGVDGHGESFDVGSPVRQTKLLGSHDIDHPGRDINKHFHHLHHHYQYQSTLQHYCGQHHNVLIVKH